MKGSITSPRLENLEDLEETMRSLERLGTAQNRKVYARHGVTGPAFGVSYKHLGELEKKLGVDHELARALWTSGNHDARVLATKIADPGAIGSRELEAWARDLDSYVLTDAFAKLLARSPHAMGKLEKWTRSRKELIARAGWLLLALVAQSDEALSDRAFQEYIAQAERRIDRAPNRVRDAMLSAIAAIGLRSPALEKRARAAAKRIGPVAVDHGETGCKTPDVADILDRAARRRRQRQRQRQ